MKPVSIVSLVLVAGIAAPPAFSQQTPGPQPYFVGNPLGLPVNPAADGAFAPMSSNVKVFGAIYANFLGGQAWWLLIIFFAIAGMGWFFPATWIIRWMSKPDA